MQIFDCRFSIADFRVSQVSVRSLDANLGLAIFALARKLPSFARLGSVGVCPYARSLYCVGPEDLR